MRTIDLAKIDDQIRKLEELRRFMADPTTAPIIEQLISQNGGSNGGISASLEIHPIAIKGNQRGDLVSAVAAVCRSRSGLGFTAKDVILQLDNQGFAFKAQDKLIAVNGALRRLVKKAVIKVAVPGGGKRPSVYKIPERFPREAEGGNG
jgi:hypothetical protein